MLAYHLLNCDGLPQMLALTMLIFLGRMAAHGLCFWAAKINIMQRKNYWPSYPFNGGFWPVGP
jgi:hypothetical protein